MSFQAIEIKNALDTLLIASAASRFSVIGARKRSADAEKIASRSQVTTYYDNGSFPKSGGSFGPFRHDCTLKIDIIVSAPAAVDLSVLQTPDAAPEQIAEALASSSDATAEADQIFDDLAAFIWDIIMRPQNSMLGLDYDPSRWITGIEKNAPASKGALVLVSGTMTMTATALEYPTEEIGKPGAYIDSVINITADKSGENLDTAAQGEKAGI